MTRHRQSLLRTLGCALVLSTLAACATNPPPEPIDLASATRIGVYSRCGTHLTRTSFALFSGVGLDEITARAVPDWKLDPLIAEALRLGLKRPSEVADIEISPELKQAALVSDFPEVAARMPAAIATAQPRADIYVVVLPISTGRIQLTAKNGDRIQIPEPNALTGFGIFSHAADRVIHAACTAFVFDTRQNRITRQLQALKAAPVPREVIADRWDGFSELQMATVQIKFTTDALAIGEKLGRDILNQSNLAPAAAK